MATSGAPAVHMRNAILFLLLTAFIVGLNFALHSLASAIGLSGFVIFCLATFALMVTAGYAFDYWQRHSRQ